MKFKRIITFSIISAISLGTLIAASEVKKPPVDRNFKTKDISGNQELLNDISIENIIKVGTNSYEKVILNGDKARFFKTDYDELHGVGEKVLKNKDLYRGSSSMVDLDHKDFLMTAGFNRQFPYGSDRAFVKIAKKDKKTGDVIKKEIDIPSIGSNQHLMNENLFQLQGKVFYAMITQNMGSGSENTLKIFSVNEKDLYVQEELSLKIKMKSSSTDGEYVDISNLVSDGKYIYSIVSSDNKFQLLKINPVTKNYSQKEIKAFDNIKGYYINRISIDKDKMYLVDNTSYVLNLHTLEMISKKPMKAIDEDSYMYTSFVDNTIKNGKLYVIYEGMKQDHTSDNLIFVFDEKTGEKLYEGKLPTMMNRGIDLPYKFVKK